MKEFWNLKERIVNKRTERQIQEIYEAVFKKIYTQKNIDALAKGSRIDITQTAALLESSEAYENFAKKFAKELAKKGIGKERGLWRKYFEAARKLHYVGLPKTWNEFEKSVMSKAIENNFKMIKSIPKQALAISQHVYTSTLIKEVAENKLSRGAFERQLKKHEAKNAKLIARTESAKLQTAILEQRAKDIGCVAYIWRASNDRRTRESHKEMNNVVVFWRPDPEKPLRDKMRGNAGEFPNCRCTPQPIIDEDDLTNATYKVYDYHTDKIITMNRFELLEALEKKEI